ncbi:4-hydroxy-3-methylbut-2-enyl diphosphate reductase [Methylophilaceae bacterium]|nr:4-hydroxy-3-methylbut-2-enyl diphosphate reductase [Methylophilaceae bacterium]
MKENIINIALANPRGFCAGVERAILIVEEALKKYGAPIYVRNEVVHNSYVINNLKKKGAIFVNNIKKIPPGSHIIFSAHGVSKAIRENADKFHLISIDATCPLVTKVHKEVHRLYDDDYHILMIGHKGHPEVEGTMGQIEKNSPDASIHLIESVEDVKKLSIVATTKISYVSQTTLSVDDTSEIICALKAKFPNIKEPQSSDICYATQNRQDAVKAMLKQQDLIFVVGSINSSNSNRLAEIANQHKVKAILIDNMSLFDPSILNNKKNIGITAGASAPEILVQQLISEIKKYSDIHISEINGIEENVIFKLPVI